MSSLYNDLSGAKVRCLLTRREYIPVKDLRERVTWETVQELLPSMFWRRWVPCWDYDLSEKIQGARRVIAILTLIGRGGAIRSLLLGKPQGPELTDRDLPLSRSGANVQSCCGERIFTSFTSWERGAIDLFLSTQWMVLEPTFKLDSATAISIRLSDYCPLQPAFASCDKVTKTETSEVIIYKGVFSPECQHGLPCVALKTFQQLRMKDFAKEKDILEMIQFMRIKNDHLVNHLAVCEEVPCIIFPWADGGDLGDFWQLKSSKTASDFLWSLRQMAGLAHALENLHGVNIRHGDIKPANILCFLENGAKVLKFTDFGISRAHTMATDFRHNKTVTSASTRAYEGPEVVFETKISRRYDCWSIGCVIIEFVVWLLYDYSALESFLRARDSEYHGYYRRRSTTSLQNQELTDRAEVHPSVYEAMNCLLDDSRCSTTALKDVINLVREGLLQIEYQRRIESATLHKELQAIFERSQVDPSYLMNSANSSIEIPEIFRLPRLYTSPQATFLYSF